MDSESDHESFDGLADGSAAEWGKAKYDYYYTDYVDKDYPSKLTAKEERLAAIEQEEALRIQRKLSAALDNVNYETVLQEETLSDGEQDLINLIEVQNNSIDKLAWLDPKVVKSTKRKRVAFEDQKESDEVESIGENDDEESSDEDESADDNKRRRRPINMAIKKNRGLTPYKKKEYRNPRVKHKLKYKKALSKRRRNVQEKQGEFYRYSGESAGIKTSTIKSIKL